MLTIFVVEKSTNIQHSTLAWHEVLHFAFLPVTEIILLDWIKALFFMTVRLHFHEMFSLTPKSFSFLLLQVISHVPKCQLWQKPQQAKLGAHWSECISCNQMFKTAVADPEGGRGGCAPSKIGQNLAKSSLFFQFWPLCPPNWLPWIHPCTA